MKIIKEVGGSKERKTQKENTEVKQKNVFKQ